MDRGLGTAGILIGGVSQCWRDESLDVLPYIKDVNPTKWTNVMLVLRDFDDAQFASTVLPGASITNLQKAAFRRGWMELVLQYYYIVEILLLNCMYAFTPHGENDMFLSVLKYIIIMLVQ